MRTVLLDALQMSCALDTSERIQSELSRLVDSVNRSNEVLFNMSQGQNQFMDDRPEISELNVSLVVYDLIFLSFLF